MKYAILSLCLCILADFLLLANDSDFYGGGGSALFPIMNNQISVKKEVLKITHRESENEDYPRRVLPITVDVDYLFYNHGKTVQLTIGFEAMLGGEEGDAIPEIKGFSVLVNGKKVKAKPQLLHDPYALSSSTVQQNKPEDENDENYRSNRYVYLFKAVLKPGYNRVKHQYKCYYTGTQVYNCASYSYDLMPALRWKNRQIDDFTLILDFDDFSQFTVDYMTQDDSKNWLFKGYGKLQYTPVTKSSDTNVYQDIPSTKVYGKKGIAIFKAKNFVPKNNLDIYLGNPIVEPKEYNKVELPLGRFCDAYFDYRDFSISELFDNQGIINISHREKIIRNLPFARRGYIFKNEILKNYYTRHTEWYEPNPSYRGEIKSFTIDEKNLLKFKYSDY
jgi:hypothetical protein